MDKPVCVWSTLNFLLVFSEVLTQYALSTRAGRYFEKFSVTSQRRLRAFFATPHFILMCISCSFFLSNWDIGILLIQKVIFGGLIPLVPLGFIMYCGCHVSMDTREWEENSAVNKKTFFRTNIPR
ncbi:hypothetical protein X975_03101, partial [Stegodyphus mimosarum]